MSRNILVALDQGTTSSRAIVFDEAGRILAAHAIEFKQHYPQPGWVEHDPEDILTTQITALQKAVEMSGVEVQDIAAIGITNQRETTLLWEKDTGQLRSQRHCLAVPPHRSLCGTAGEGGQGRPDPPEDRAGAGRVFQRHQAGIICWTR